VQLARALGAAKVFAIDINPKKIEIASRFGAIPVDPSEIRDVDVALELIGLPETMRQAVQSLGKMGRAALVGITEKTFDLAPYHEIINKEAEIIGVSDHLASEIPELLELVRTGQLDLSHGIIRTIPLEAKAINESLDSLESFGDDVRVVITA
nr:zinc-binding dehydrogenase [Verrucomicrobiota bacterium]